VEKVAALAKDADVLIGVGGSFNIPSPAICDPELTMSLPPVVTAFTGMDALTHAIEGYVSRASDTFSEALAEKAIKLIAGALRRATFNGEHDRQARYDMMMGRTLAAMNFCNSILGISHSMAPPSALTSMCPTVSETPSVCRWSCSLTCGPIRGSLLKSQGYSTGTSPVWI